MVKLQKLILRNFKSFRKADIPLSKGFTAIVGSNGSGKTNILDALLFVLGTSSIKMLRASRIEELVNNTSDENYAKVELVIKDGEKTYTIQRMIDKQGKCVYRLDGKRKTRNEVSSLLLELGIKPDGHNIVVQGDTTRVIEMSPVERRQIIDELAGLQEFDAKKEEALKELQKVDNKLRDAGIVMQERENYLEQLRRDKDAASEFDSLQNEGRRIKATMIFSEMERIEKEEGECGKNLGAISSEREELEGKIGKELGEKALLREEAEKLNKAVLSQREKIYATVGAQLEEARTKKALVQERIGNQKQQVEKNAGRASELEEKAEAVEKEIAKTKARVKEIGVSLEAIARKIKEAGEKKAGLQAGVEQREKRIAELNEAKENLSSELGSLNEALAEKRAMLVGLQREIESKKQAMRENMQSIEAMQAKVSEREKKAALLAQLRSKFGNIDERLSKTQKESDASLEALKEAEAERKNVAESIELLEKSGATCPVCDSALEKGKKAGIKAKKEARLKLLLEKERVLRERKKDIDIRIAEARDASGREKTLSFETADLEELRKSVGESRARLGEIKQWLSANTVERLREEAEELERKAGAKRPALNAQKEKISAFREGVALSVFREASDRLALLEKEGHLLRQERESLLGGMAKHLESQKASFLEEAGLLSEEAANLSATIETEEKELARLEASVSGLEAKVGEAEKQGRKMVEEKEKAEKAMASLEEAVSKKQARLKGIGQQENVLLIEKSRREVRIADLGEEGAQFKGVEALQEFKAEELAKRLVAVEKRVRELGAINMKALESYNQLEAEVIDVRKKVGQLDQERIAVVEMIEKIDFKRTTVFMDCFNELNKNFSKMFNTLFNGEGLLELSNKDNPLEAGLLIQAKHKGDNIKNIDSMSGGEKTMTALAFLFAIQLYEPASFYVFDEADAALDKENSIKMASIIKEISKQSQFIAITHNDPLVQEADQIIGVALNKEKSSVIGLKLRDKIGAESTES
ncbi:MAG: AAA family ATPase [archaeon]